ncbi:hypothetical protein AVEN_130979-1 [Araneus ventricosus]|uniref:Uncharacterized protein n=1 Tax=Araneus ventricosus TaxID=182803 RepID=A0A4Y2DG57_ARAVE|nr:hypothetical protein AVEN_130979-1 [Araneus ventricosus]
MILDESLFGESTIPTDTHPSTEKPIIRVEVKSVCEEKLVRRQSISVCLVGFVTARRYLDEVFGTYQRHFCGNNVVHFILMYGNARLEGTQLVDDFLEEEGVC